MLIAKTANQKLFKTNTTEAVTPDPAVVGTRHKFPTHDSKIAHDIICGDPVKYLQALP